MKLGNQKGSALAAFLALLPLIVSIIAALVSIFLLIHHVQKSSYICRSQVLDTQNQMLGRMQQLTSLNPAATELRFERVAAENEVRAAAGFPLAMPAAAAHLASVVARQIALSGTQRALITGSYAQALSAQERTRSQIGRLDGVRAVSTKTPRLQVKPQQDDTPTPDYQPSDTIEQDQTFELNWTVHPLELLPGWIQKLFDQKDFAIQSTCGSKPKQAGATASPTAKGASPWTAILKKDKS